MRCVLLLSLVAYSACTVTSIKGVLAASSTQTALEQHLLFVDSKPTGAASLSSVVTTAAITGDFYLGPQVTAATNTPHVDWCAPATTARIASLTTNTITEGTTGALTPWRDLEYEDKPRALCYVATGLAPARRWTGFFVKVEYMCNAAQAALCSGKTFPTTGTFSTMTATEQAQYRARFTGATSTCSDTSTGPLAQGVCYNNRVQAQCGFTPYSRSHFQCCQSSTAIAPVLQTVGSRCPCSGTPSNNATANAMCPTGQTCCLPTKFTELNSNTYSGECYDPANERCCDTGRVYNPGTDQCCVVNGVQSRDEPCPCGVDADCGGGTKTCCQQLTPAPEEGTGACSKYQNFPSGSIAHDPTVGTGQAVAAAQRCAGTCIDSRYQICCNGATCIKEYERCCNTTCCNKFVGSCSRGLRPGAAGQIYNGLDFGTQFEQCTILEQISPLKAFWIFLLPTFLLLASILTLAVVLAYASKAEPRAFSLLEKCMIAVGIIGLLLCFPIFFSPLYKYGVVCVAASLIAILSGAALSKRLNLFAVVILGLALLYLIDPFHGSNLMNFSNLRVDNHHQATAGASASDGRVDRWSAGYIHHAVKLQKAEAAFQAQSPTANLLRGAYCTQFYDYFRLDPQLLDTVRMDNPEVTTFGYCSRGWTMALLLFGGLLLVVMGVLFLLALLGLVSRFPKAKNLALEIVPDGGDVIIG